MNASHIGRAFVLGTSLPVVLPFLLGVQAMPEKKFDYAPYSLVAPLYFGSVTALTTAYAPKRLFLVSQLSAFAVMAWITARQSYRFKSQTRWWMQYAILWVVHTFTFNVVIRRLLRYFDIPTS